MRNKIVSIKSKEPDRFYDLGPNDLTVSEKASVVCLALLTLKQKHRLGVLLNDGNATRHFLQIKLSDRLHEVFGVICLDNRHRVLSVDDLFQGTIDGASVYPRVVVQHALQKNAAAVIFYHNHPSGVAEPSKSDEVMTARLKDALALIDINVLDHMVVGAEGIVSMAERGML